MRRALRWIGWGFAGVVSLVALGAVFRRDHSGRWSALRAVDQGFVYRHYASGVNGQFGNSW